MQVYSYLYGKLVLSGHLKKFLKNYLKGKNALQNQAGSERFAWKDQYYMLQYQLLTIYVVILWKSD